MTFTSLASSSHGNCYVVNDGETAILLECGISFRRIKKELGFGLSALFLAAFLLPCRPVLLVCQTALILELPSAACQHSNA